MNHNFGEKNMKSFILLTIMCCTMQSLSAQSQSQKDFADISQCVSYYLEGGTNNDYELLAKAFHPDASMTYIADGKYKSVNALEFFKAGIKPGPPQNRKTSILSIDVEGHAANAKLKIQYPDFYFMDYMNLLKIDGEWKIVSKIFYKG